MPYARRMTRILMIGLEPTLVDFSSLPGVNAQMIARGLASSRQQLRDLGFDAEWCLTDLGETAEAVVRAELAARTYDAVLIGAGIRTIPAYFSLFERLINVVHEAAPTSKICFNTEPDDTTDAVLRWIPAPSPR